LAISISETSPFVVTGNTTLNFFLGIGVSTNCASIDDTQVTSNPGDHNSGDGIYGIGCRGWRVQPRSGLLRAGASRPQAPLRGAQRPVIRETQ
jgi:hypothetical protein